MLTLKFLWTYVMVLFVIIMLFAALRKEWVYYAISLLMGMYSTYKSEYYWGNGD